MNYQTVSVVIPVYNEESYITTTLENILQAEVGGLSKEIIIVDDASTDKTSEMVRNLFKKLKNQHVNAKITIDKETFNLSTNSYQLKFISKTKNEGKGAALKTGFLYTTGDIVIVQDADLEYRPEEYPLLLKPFFSNHADVVYGSRFISNRPHRVLYYWHYMANIFLTTLSNMLTNLNLTDMETGYKVFRGELIRGIAPRLQSKRFGFEPEITARISKIPDLKIYEVGISYYGRTYSEGKKIGWKDGMRAIWEIIKYNIFS